MSQVSLNRASTDRPHCDTCDLSMWLLSIKPTDREQELRSYECARCGASQTVLMTAEPQRNTALPDPGRELPSGSTVKAIELDGPRQHLAEENVPRIQHDPPMPTDTEEFRAWARKYFASSDTA